MNRMKVTCGTCCGVGYFTKWKMVAMNDNISTMEREDAVCDACNGLGYTEYAVFSIEEADVILKHCGLSTEVKE